MIRSIYLAFIALILAGNLFAQESWNVTGIRVDGNQRISTGTILNYLTLSVGDEINQQDIQESIRSLYGTGFFRDIEIRRLEDLLIISVLERPSIAEFSIEGNELISTEDLQGPLNDAGLVQGEIFTQSTLDEIVMALTDQYYSMGHYELNIDSDIQENPNNTVDVNIIMNEGERARIASITIFGNESFSDEELRDEFELSTGSWLSFFRNDDRYSAEALETDIETLRSFYMDRGYANFELTNNSVSISEDSSEIYITLSISEGEQFTISNVAIAGNFDEDRDTIESLIFIQNDEQYSQGRIAANEELLRSYFNNLGFAFAQVTGIPEINEEENLVDLTFFIDPQERIYVRNIIFDGVTSVNDDVLRREMRQFEGGFLSNALVDRSQVRLQRLAFLESVDYEVVPVPGVNDQVDVVFNLTERIPGQFGGGLGYSGLYGASLNGNLIHSNFLGRGERVAINLSYGEFAKMYTVSHTNPYANEDGVSRLVSFSLRDYKRFTTESSDSSLTSGTIGLSYTVPISEVQSIRYGVNLQRYSLGTSPWSSDQTRQWVESQPYVEDQGDGYLTAVTDTAEMVFGWGYDSRDRFLFPTRGSQLGLVLNSTIPGGEAEYYVGTLDFSNYLPLFANFTLKTGLKFYYGEGFGDTEGPPVYRNFYGGGSNSVRGIKDNWMGPIDSRGRPFGGNVLFATQFDLYFPPIEAFQNMRFGFFYDIGNIFTTANVDFFDKLGDPINHDIDYNNLKQSFGFAAEWLAPMGLLKFSFGKLLNAQSEDDRFYGDRTEEFQFTMGNAF